MSIDPQQLLRRLPIGVQSFEDLRTVGFLYVDKTEYVYRLAKTGGKAYFLSRPRPFGKSLLLSTLRAYFEGKKELFHGLAIEQLEKEWTAYPVLHLSLNAEKYDSNERLEAILERQLMDWEKLYETGGEGITYSGRFMTVIQKAREKTGQKVVVLIDEYDKPLLRTFHDETLQKEFRETLTAFYTVLKDADPWLKFVFITGVTKFAQVGVFSTMNQLSDISLTPQYAALCGLTRPEIEANFDPELKVMAVENGLTDEETRRRLTEMYDGYHFCEGIKEGMFNPFSVLSALNYHKFRNYWFATGTPAFLVEMLKKTEYDLRELEGIEVTAASLMNDRMDVRNPIPIIYQSGYLTIKGFHDEFSIYTLGYPNEEVKYGFFNFIAPFYTPVAGDTTPFHIGKFTNELRAGDTAAFLTRLRTFFAGIPYELSDETERHYQVIFYLVFKLMGQYSDVEVRSNHGRADAVVKTPEYTCVFEFKLNGTAEEALRQIDEKEYLIPYTADGRKLIKVGVAFSKETRNIDRWLVAPAL